MNPEDRKVVIIELVDEVRKSWWTVIAAVCFGLAGGLIATPYVPKVYEASTTMRIAPQSIPEDFLQTTVTETLAHRRLELMSAIKNRSYLEELMVRTVGAPNDDAERDAFVRGIRGSLVVDMPRGSNVLTLTIKDGDPERAEGLVNALTKLYVEDHAESRASQAESTRQTFDDLASGAQEEFDEIDEQLNEFNTNHRFETESYLNANLTLLENGRRDIRINQGEQARLVEQIKTLKARIEQSNAALGNPMMPVGVDVLVDPSTQRLALLEAELQSLKVRYSDAHPSVVQKQRQVEDLRAALLGSSPDSGTPGEGGKPRRPIDPYVASLQAEIDEARREVARLKSDEGGMRRDVVKIETRISHTPEIQGRFNELTEQHRLLRERYLDYRGKAERSKQSELLEESHRGERLEVTEWAIVPFRPIFPNPMYIHLLGVGVGVLLFLGPLLLRHFVNPVIASEAGMRGSIDVPVLVSIPKVMTPENERASRAQFLKNMGLSALSTAALAAVAVFFLV